MLFRIVPQLMCKGTTKNANKQENSEKTEKIPTNAIQLYFLQV